MMEGKYLARSIPVDGSMFSRLGLGEANVDGQPRMFRLLNIPETQLENYSLYPVGTILMLAKSKVYFKKEELLFGGKMLKHKRTDGIGECSACSLDAEWLRANCPHLTAQINNHWVFAL